MEWLKNTHVPTRPKLEIAVKVLWNWGQLDKYKVLPIYKAIINSNI